FRDLHSFPTRRSSDLITTVHKPCRVVAQEYVFGATFHVVRLKQHFVVQLNNAHCAVTTQHLNVLTSLCFVALRYSNKPTLMTLHKTRIGLANLRVKRVHVYFSGTLCQFQISHNTAA